jgi:hypothetical protein
VAAAVTVEAVVCYRFSPLVALAVWAEQDPLAAIFPGWVARVDKVAGVAFGWAMAVMAARVAIRAGTVATAARWGCCQSWDEVAMVDRAARARRVGREPTVRSSIGTAPMDSMVVLAAEVVMAATAALSSDAVVMAAMPALAGWED